MQKMIILTYQLRAEILTALRESLYKGKREKLQEKLNAIADAAYRNFISEEVEDHLERIPRDLGMLRYDSGYAFDLSDKFIPDEYKSILTHWQWRKFHGYFKRSRPVPIHQTIYLGEALTKRAAKYVAEMARMDIDRKAILKTSEDLMKTCRTVRSLLEKWPEAKQFIPEHIWTDTPNLPTVCVGDLNDQLKAAGVKLRKAA